MPATTSQDRNGDHASTKEDIKDHCNESEESDAAEEAREEDGENCVQHSCAGNTLDRLLPLRNGRVCVVSSEMRKEVRENA